MEFKDTLLLEEEQRWQSENQVRGFVLKQTDKAPELTDVIEVWGVVRQAQFFDEVEDEDGKTRRKPKKSGGMPDISHAIGQRTGEPL